MISRWGWEEGLEYETKIWNVIFSRFLHPVFMSVHIAIVHLVITSVIALCTWYIYAEFSLQLPQRPKFSHHRVTQRHFRSPLKWSPTLGFKACLWWKIYDLSIKKVLGCQPLKPRWSKRDFYLHPELVLAFALKNKIVQWFIEFWYQSRAYIDCSVIG